MVIMRDLRTTLTSCKESVCECLGGCDPEITDITLYIP